MSSTVRSGRNCSKEGEGVKNDQYINIVRERDINATGTSTANAGSDSKHL